MNKTIISWTDMTWNVWSGCAPVSPGCAHCYAQRLAEQKRGTKAFPQGFELTYRWHKLYEPLKLKTPMRIFVNSMTDLFWEQISIEDIKRVFAVMNECHDRQIGHTFQILTKRSKRLVELAHNLNWTPNIWIGVSVENQRWTSRITDLVAVPAAIRFISAEPLLGPIDLTQWIDKIHWVIVGGESGPKFRPMRQDWARSLRTQCEERGVAFFYKQDAAGRTETRPYLVEVDGSHTRYHQLPR